MRFDLDSPVACADGAFGELSDVVIDPRQRRLTHLVVQPHDRHDLARLVPVARARAGEGSGGGVTLDCTLAELVTVDPLQRAEYVRLGEGPVPDAKWDVGVQDMSGLPPIGSLGVSPLGNGIETFDPDPHVSLAYDRVPKGRVELRRDSEVFSSDGHQLGRLLAFVTDSEDQIRHVVIEHGHLWRKRELAIPITSVDRIESDQLVLTLSHDEVGR